MSRIRWQIAQYFEIIWWKQYLRKKSTVDYLHWKRKYWDDFLKNIDIPNRQSIKILDAGCGPAGIFMNFNNAKLTAVDPLLSEYDHLDHFNQEWYPNVSFLQQTIEELKSKEEFDVVFCINAINHVNDLEAAIRSLYDCTKKEGHLIISIDAHKYPALKNILKVLPADILHPHQYNADEYGRLLYKTGWQVKSVQRLKAGKIFDYYLFTCRK